MVAKLFGGVTRMNPIQQQTRRQLFANCGVGVGKIALASMLAKSSAHANLFDTDFPSPTAPKDPHFTPKVKRVIYLFQAGAPSQLELFDHKPKLAEYEGKPIPESVRKGQRYAFIQPNAAVLGPRFKFAKHGQSGAEISEMLPHLSSIVDDLSLIHISEPTRPY